VYYIELLGNSPDGPKQVGDILKVVWVAPKQLIWLVFIFVIIASIFMVEEQAACDIC
jgi:hypothetical protein